MLAFVSRYVVIFACLLPLAGPSQASDAALSNQIALYNKAWLETDPAARSALLRQAWATQGRYQDPTVALVGADALSRHIGQFLALYPKASMATTSKIDSYGSVFRFAWRIDLGNGAPVIDGEDFGSVDADGRIHAITGFFGTLPNAARSKNEAAAALYLDTLFNRFDHATLDKLIAKDAVYTQAKGLPYGGTYTGLAGMMTMFQKSRSVTSVKLLDKPVLFTDAASGRVVATFNVRFMSPKGKWQVDLPIAEWFDFKDGLITGITPYYFDTKALSELIATDR